MTNIPEALSNISQQASHRLYTPTLRHARAHSRDLLTISNTFSLSPSVFTILSSCAFIISCLFSSYLRQRVKPPTILAATPPLSLSILSTMSPRNSYPLPSAAWKLVGVPPTNPPTSEYTLLGFLMSNAG